MNNTLLDPRLMNGTLLDTLRTFNLTTDFSYVTNITDLIQIPLYKADFDKYVFGSDNYTVLNNTLYLRESLRIAKMDDIRYGTLQIIKICLFGLLVLVALGFSIAPLRSWLGARRPKKCQALMLMLMAYGLVSFFCINDCHRSL